MIIQNYNMFTMKKSESHLGSHCTNTLRFYSTYFFSLYLSNTFLTLDLCGSWFSCLLLHAVCGVCSNYVQDNTDALDRQLNRALPTQVQQSPMAKGSVSWLKYYIQILINTLIRERFKTGLTKRSLVFTAYMNLWKYS